MITYPVGYGRQTVSLRELRNMHSNFMHPEYEDRLFKWIEDQGGNIGIGGGLRDKQPDPLPPGFAPEGKSFHQLQAFGNNYYYCAVDLVAKNGNNVHRAPTWDEVPAQGSDWAKAVGLHANVGTPPRGEPWHLQPIEIDGWGSWVNAGRPDLKPNYLNKPEQDDDTMLVAYVRMDGTTAVYRQWSNGTKTWVKNQGELNVHNFISGSPADVKVLPNADWLRAAGVIVGPIPPGVDGWGVPK